MTEQVIIYLNGSTQETMLAEGERFFKDYGYLECGDDFLEREGRWIVSKNVSGRYNDRPFATVRDAMDEASFHPSQTQQVEEIKEGWTSYDLYRKVEELEGEVKSLKAGNKRFLEVLKKDLLEAGILETDVNDKIKQALLSIGIKYD